MPFGEIIEVNLPSSSSSGAANSDSRDNDLNNSGSTKHRGFGYVEFESQEDAAAAIDNMDQAMLAGRVLTVAPAKPQKDVGNILGSRVAVWEQARPPPPLSSAAWLMLGRRKTGSGSTKCRRKTGLRRSRPRPRRWLRRRQPTPCKGWRASIWPGRSLRPSRPRRGRCGMAAIAVDASQSRSTRSSRYVDGQFGRTGIVVVGGVYTHNTQQQLIDWAAMGTEKQCQTRLQIPSTRIPTPPAPPK